MAKRRTLSFLLKLAFSAAALVVFFLASKVAFRDIGRTLAGVAWGWLAVAFSLLALGLVFSAYRWRILVRAQGDDAPLGFLVRSYLVGTFFNNFLPTRFGGDAVRIWDGSKHSRSTRTTAEDRTSERECFDPSQMRTTSPPKRVGRKLLKNVPTR
jgi:uncharacterized protein (TIRG00374 family)